LQKLFLRVCKIKGAKVISCFPTFGTTIIPHHPLVVQKINILRVLLPCACGKCIHSGYISFRVLRSFRKTNSLRFPTLQFAFILCIHLSTQRLREILISISQAPYIPFSPSPFTTHFQRYIFISATSLPLK